MSVNNINLNLNNKIIVHPSFNETIKELRDLNIKLPDFGTEENWDFSMNPFPKDGNLVTNIEEIKPYKLNAINGQNIANLKYPILAYDESIQNFMALEGISYFLSHSIVIHGKDDFIPSIFISFQFYTRVKPIIKKSKNIIESNNPSVDSKTYYARERSKFILDNTPDNSIILIDGPLIGGQINNITVKLNKDLLKKNVIPIFIVKNSNSNLVTQNISELKGNFNSDMHWCFRALKPGERTNFFSYVDQYNPNNGKIFCYLKPFNVSPQRIEFHIETYKKHKNVINSLMDFIYYLILIQGDLKNPQVRSIAIAEMFARISLRMFDMRMLLKEIGLTTTINESRFGGRK